MNLADRIKHIREEFGISQEKLAEILGTSIGVPKGLEQGVTKRIKSRYSLLLSERFNLNREWVENGKGEMRIKEDNKMLNDISLITNVLDPGNITIEYFEDIESFIDKDIPEHKKFINLPKSLITSSKNICAIRIEDSPMGETIESGNIMLVDKSVKTISSSNIYISKIDGEIYIRRIFTIPGSTKLIVKSDNLSYPEYHLEKNQVEILGKVKGTFAIKSL